MKNNELSLLFIKKRNEFKNKEIKTLYIPHKKLKEKIYNNKLIELNNQINNNVIYEKYNMKEHIQKKSIDDYFEKLIIKTDIIENEIFDKNNDFEIIKYPIIIESKINIINSNSIIKNLEKKNISRYHQEYIILDHDNQLNLIFENEYLGNLEKDIEKNIVNIINLKNSYLILFLLSTNRVKILIIIFSLHNLYYKSFEFNSIFLYKYTNNFFQNLISCKTYLNYYSEFCKKEEKLSILNLKSYKISQNLKINENIIKSFFFKKLNSKFQFEKLEINMHTHSFNKINKFYLEKFICQSYNLNLPKLIFLLKNNYLHFIEIIEYKNSTIELLNKTWELKKIQNNYSKYSYLFKKNSIINIKNKRNILIDNSIINKFLLKERLSTILVNENFQTKKINFKKNIIYFNSLLYSLAFENLKIIKKNLIKLMKNDLLNHQNDTFECENNNYFFYLNNIFLNCEIQDYRFNRLILKISKEISKFNNTEEFIKLTKSKDNLVITIFNRINEFIQNGSNNINGISKNVFIKNILNKIKIISTYFNCSKYYIQFSQELYFELSIVNNLINCFGIFYDYNYISKKINKYQTNKINDYETKYFLINSNDLISLNNNSIAYQFLKFYEKIYIHNGDPYVFNFNFDKNIKTISNTKLHDLVINLFINYIFIYFKFSKISIKNSKLLKNEINNQFRLLINTSIIPNPIIKKCVNYQFSSFNFIADMIIILIEKICFNPFIKVLLLLLYLNLGYPFISYKNGILWSILISILQEIQKSNYSYQILNKISNDLFLYFDVKIKLYLISMKKSKEIIISTENNYFLYINPFILNYNYHNNLVHLDFSIIFLLINQILKINNTIDSFKDNWKLSDYFSRNKSVLNNFEIIEIEKDSIYDVKSGRRVFENKQDVETIALEFYKQTYNYLGIHGENLIIPLLLEIFFYEILYENKFYSKELLDEEFNNYYLHPYHNLPFDIFTSNFKNRNLEKIQKKINEIKNYTYKDITIQINQFYNSYIENSTFFQKDLDIHSQENINFISIAFGGKKLGNLFNIILNKLQFCGFLDLFLWPNEINNDKIFGQIIICEVKSVNDFLKENQIWWIGNLLQCDIKVNILKIK